MTNSLRFRLTALYLGLFTVLFLLFSLGLYTVMSRSLSARMDQALATEVDTAVVLFLDEMGETKGDARASAAETVAGMKLHGDAIAVVDGSETLAITPVVGGGARRVVERAVESYGRTFRVVASAPLESIEAPLAVARQAIFLVLPLALALAGVGGWLLATRALKPLYTVAEQAARIGGRSLHTRLDPGRATEELRVLVDSFNDLLSRLDQSFEAMRRFVADASHELRTPVSIIRGEADVALSRDRPAAEYRESLTRHPRGIAAAQPPDRRPLESRPGRRRACAVAAARVLSERAAERMLPVRSAAGRGPGRLLDCRAGEDLQYQGDEQLLRRLVLNLLDNAIRYTPRGGAFPLRSKAARPASGSWSPIPASASRRPNPPRLRALLSRRRGPLARRRRLRPRPVDCAIDRRSPPRRRRMRQHPGSGSTFTVTLPA